MAGWYGLVRMKLCLFVLSDYHCKDLFHNGNDITIWFFSVFNIVLR